MRSTRRRMGTPAWLGLTLVAALPALAEAQLFPNRTITRQKESCAAEPPFYSTVRRNYYGFYPTCWSKFPDGWGCPCPNPELPNRVAAFADQPRDKFKPIVQDDIEGGLPPDDTAPGMDSRAPEEAMPPVPNPTGRSPFGAELNPPEVNPKPVAPDSTGAPRTSRSSSPASRPGATPATSSTSGSSATVGLLEMPPMAPPTAAPSAEKSDFNPGTLALAPEATLTSNDSSARSNLGPSPAAPMPGGSTPIASELSADPTVLAGPPPSASPAQAPQRKGILGGLFNSSKRRR